MQGHILTEVVIDWKVKGVFVPSMKIWRRIHGGFLFNIGRTIDTTMCSLSWAVVFRGVRFQSHNVVNLLGVPE